MSELDKIEGNALEIARMLTDEVHQYRLRIRNAILSFITLCGAVSAYIYKERSEVLWLVALLLVMTTAVVALLVAEFVRLSGWRSQYCLVLRQELIRTVRVPGECPVEFTGDLLDSPLKKEDIAGKLRRARRFGVLRVYQAVIWVSWFSVALLTVFSVT